jgi:hypothetical protein
MYFDNAVSIYRQRIVAEANKDAYLSERLREKFQWACRQHCKQTGEQYLKTFYAAIDRA